MPEHAVTTYVISRYSSSQKRINIFSPDWLWQQCTVTKRGAWNQARSLVSKNFISTDAGSVRILRQKWPLSAADGFNPLGQLGQTSDTSFALYYGFSPHKHYTHITESHRITV